MRASQVRRLTSKNVLRQADMLDREWVGISKASGIMACLLIECETAGRILLLGTRYRLGHVATRRVLDALSMATLMRRIVGEAHRYSPGANPEAQQWRLDAERGRGAVHLAGELADARRLEGQSRGPRRVGKWPLR